MKMPLKSLFFWGLVSVAACFPERALALTADELRQRAESITVKIEVEKCSDVSTTQPCPYAPAGSGVLIASSNGRTYYVLTANHVVKDIQIPNTDYRVVTADGQTYPLRMVIDAAQKPVIQGSDLALVAFDGSGGLPTAQVSTVCVLREWSGLGEDEGGDFPDSDFCQPRADLDQPSQQVLVAGYPNGGENLGQFVLTLGSFVDRSSQSLAAQTPMAGGYEFLYTNPTEQGMSGGPILDTSGQLIGIHGRAEGDQLEGIIYGYSLGIPIDSFLRQFVKSSIVKTPNFQMHSTLSLPEVLPAQEVAALLGGNISACPRFRVDGVDAQEWIKQGNRFFRLSDYNQSLNCLNRAIDANPTSPVAFFVKGFVMLQQVTQQPDSLVRERNFEEVHQLFEQAITLATEQESKYRDVYIFWRWQGVVLTQLERYEQALAAFDNATAACENFKERASFCDQQNQNYSQAWAGKAFVLDKLGQFEEAEQARYFAGQESTGYQALMLRGVILYKLAGQGMRQHRLEEALDSFEQALALTTVGQLSREWIEAHLYANKILDELGRSDEIKNPFLLLKEDANTSTAVFEFTNELWDEVYWRAELATAVSDFYRSTITREPSNYLAHYYLGMILAKLVTSYQRNDSSSYISNYIFIWENSTNSYNACMRATLLKPDFSPAHECVIRMQSVLQDFKYLQEQCQNLAEIRSEEEDLLRRFLTYMDSIGSSYGTVTSVFDQISLLNTIYTASGSSADCKAYTYRLYKYGVFFEKFHLNPFLDNLNFSQD